MSDSKILFLDIDDTLLCRDKTLTPENDALIRTALQEGHHIVICSGRPLAGILPVAERLDLLKPGCFLIAFNGGLIYDCGKKKPVFEKTLPLKDVRLLFKKADEHGLYIQTYDDRNLLIRKETEETRFYTGRISVIPRVMPDLPDGLEKEPVKALLVELHDKSRLDRYREEVAPIVKGRVSLFYSSEYLLECVKEGISKGAAVKWLCGYLGIPLTSSVAAGDSENDIPMLEAAHVGCAMKNATDACKEAADYITEQDCDHSGVAEIIRRFIL